MTENRLTNLALLHIHSDIEINYQEAIDVFAKKHPRRMELENLMQD